MKKYLLLIPLLFFIATPAFAANTTGNAWSESVGWFDFSNVTVSDSSLSGYAYNDNTGWLVLDGVTTNSAGTLSGYAWSESVGYFSFDNVTISSGSFGGYAYNDNTGWLSFEDGTDVTTTWAPASPSNDDEQINTYGYYPSSVRQNTQQQANTTSSNTNNSISKTPSTNSEVRDLKIGDTGNDVKVLQMVLNLLGYKVADEGPGSPGNETEMFGTLTRQAVIRFQQENNIQPTVGYFGPLTRTAIIQKLLSKFLTTSSQ